MPKIDLQAINALPEDEREEAIDNAGKELAEAVLRGDVSPDEIEEVEELIADIGELLAQHRRPH